MKKLLYLVAVTIFITACSKEEQLVVEPTERLQQELNNQSITSYRCTSLEYQVVSYSEGIVNKGYNSSILFYPENKLGKLPVVIVMHGWLGSKEKMSWIAEELAEHGFAAIAISASNYKNVFTNPKDWVQNYRNAIESVQEENKRVGSPLFDKLDTTKISIVGHSMGGGGALYYADKNEFNLKSVVALAPYSLAIRKPGATITSPTLIIAGGRDMLALPIMTKAFYKTNNSNPKDYIFYDKVGHNDFEKGGKFHDEIGADVVSWLVQYGI